MFSSEDIFILAGAFIVLALPLLLLGRWGRRGAEREIREWANQLTYINPSKYKPEDIDTWILEVFRKARKDIKPRRVVVKNITFVKNLVNELRAHSGENSAKKDKLEKEWEEAMRNIKERYKRTLRHF